VLIKKKEITELSEKIRSAIDGKPVEFLDNREGSMSILKNDINTLVNIKEDEMRLARQERDVYARYLADISHQLKTPLTSMMIMADLMDEASPEKQKEFNDNIKTSLVRMEWLTSCLLKMAKLDSNTVEFHQTKISVCELIQMSKQALEILLDIKDQTIKIKNDVVIVCDKKWTAEAITNILKNASEHSPNGSEIMIDSGNNPIYTWISITDHGQGFDKEKYASLFNRFEYTGSKNGYGIGLSLSLSIIRGQGGDIEVDGGHDNQGATFTIKLYK